MGLIERRAVSGPVNSDFTIDQEWARYTPEEHARWDALFARQSALLPGRACDEFIEAIKALRLSEAGIPDLERLSDRLEALTGWRVVAVPGLVPDDVFFTHLANKRFPAGVFIRREDEMDYIEEPDIFHDVFGHVPLLANPIFSDFMQAYGQGGLRAEGLGVLHRLARFYWYTVEFGLVWSPEGLRVYGAGILSSAAETEFALKDLSPNRIGFSPERLMRTNYRIDDFQQTYFVAESLEALLAESYRDFGPLYERLDGMPDLEPGDVIEGDAVFNLGSQAYFDGTA